MQDQLFRCSASFRYYSVAPTVALTGSSEASVVLIAFGNPSICFHDLENVALVVGVEHFYLCNEKQASSLKPPFLLKRAVQLLGIS